MSSPPPSVQGTMGALFIGMVVANLLYGISIVQAYYYYRHQKDKHYLVALVTVVMVCDTIHQALITHVVYHYVVSSWGMVDELGKIVPSLAVQNFFNGFTEFLVQSFLTVRLWRLSNGNIPLTTLVAMLVLAGFAFVFAYTILEAQFVTFAPLGTLKPLSLAVNILAAVCDLLIAVSLCVMLHRSRTGFQRSDTMINKLMVFSVNTGLITSFFAIASFITYMAAPNTLIYVGFYFCIGRLYTNSLLATLNARKMIRNGSNNNHNPNANDNLVTLSLSDISKQKTSSKRGAANIAIKINTTKEHVTDFTYEGDEKIETTCTNAEGEIKSVAV